MKLIQLIASPVLMYILAGLYALMLAVATFVENSYGPAIAREYFYYAPGLYCCSYCRQLIYRLCFFREAISRESVKAV